MIPKKKNSSRFPAFGNSGNLTREARMVTRGTSSAQNAEDQLQPLPAETDGALALDPVADCAVDHCVSRCKAAKRDELPEAL
jgi:hypothetical protein